MFLTAGSDLSILDLSKMDESTLSVVMPASIIAAVVVVVLILFRFAIVEAVRKWIYHYPVLSLATKGFAIAGTVVLAISDFFAVSTLFAYAKDVDPTTAILLSGTFAAFLEGFAFLLGIFLSRLTDPTNYRKGEFGANLFGVILMAIALLASWALAVGLRINNLRLEMIKEVVDESVVTVGYIMETISPESLFMMFSPVLTSVLAMGLSWMAYPHDSLRSQERAVEYRLNRYLRFRKRYQKKLVRYQQRKTRLWTLLTSEYEEIDSV